MEYDMWNNFKIAKKLTIAFGVIILTIVMVSASVFYTIGQLQQANFWNDHTYKVLAQIDTIISGMVNQETGLRGYLVGGTPNFLEPYKSGQAEADNAVAETQHLTADNPTQQKRIDEVLKPLIKQWREIHAEPTIKLMGDAATREEARSHEANGNGKKYMDAIRAVAKDMRDMESSLLSVRSAYADQMHSAAEWVLIVGGIVSIGFALFMGMLFAKTVTNPVVRITDAMRRITEGDLTASIDQTDRTDEVGALSQTARAFADAARKLKAEAEASLDRDTVERERKAVEEAKARETAEDTFAFSELGKGLKALSDGDLTHRITAEFAPKTQQLRHDFNEAITKLEQSMQVVSTNAGTILMGSDEITSASDDLSRRSETQAASLEETAAALDEITVTVRKTAEGANHAHKVVGTAKEDAAHSGQIVRQAIEAMSSIEQSSSQIAQIIGVIDEIAFQTNLLALNAGVEAARAGDAGRGFAVVASEVRALAQRSADAAREIKKLISESTTKVGQGVDLVGQTGTALERIVTQIIELNSIISDIANSAKEQSVGLEQVNTTVNQIDQLTQQNASMVEESTAASHALAKEAEELSRLIANFKLTRNGTAEAVRSNRPPRTAAKPAAPRSGAATTTAMKTVGRGGAARKPQAGAEEEWSEF